MYTTAVETQKLLSSTATQKTQETQETAKRSRMLEILKKIETVFLDVAMDSNSHRWIFKI